MKLSRSSFVFLSLLLSSLAIPQTARAITTDGEVIFDSYTPPNQGGISTADQGSVTELHVSTDISISGFGIFNGMSVPGNLRFAILSYPDPQFIYLSDAVHFDADPSDGSSWKDSAPLDIQLQAGHSYLFGYLYDVDVSDYLDFIPESQNGITSGYGFHGLEGFEHPTYNSEFLLEGDGAVRLYSVPEAGIPAMILGSVLAAMRYRRR